MYCDITNTSGMHARSNFDKHGADAFTDMNSYPNVLTPPMDSPDSIMLSPSSGSSSPSQTYVPQVFPQNYTFGFNNLQIRASNQGIGPYLSMVEEPVDKFRFRYKSEMAGTHGSLTGQNSDRSRKQTYPTVELHNYNKPAVVRCSLFQYSREEMIHTRMPHAHRLVRKHGSDEVDDPHDIHINEDTGYTATFHSMGIIHTAKKYIVPELDKKNRKLKMEEIARKDHTCRSLTKREEQEVRSMADRESKTINLNIVCLRFDAFKVVNNIYYPLCPPLYSNPINNLKSALTGDLKIVRMDHCTSSCRGGQEIFIFVEKVTKKNIKIRFFELDDGDKEVWYDYGRFSELDVHHQYAIAFKTPPYKNLDINKQVKVFMELERPSDGARSEPKDFMYNPCDITLGRKRARYSSSNYSSSNYSSNELPLILNNFDKGQNISSDPEMNASELDKILNTNDIDSSEFNKLCEAMCLSGSLTPNMYAEEITPEDIKSLAFDAPQLLSDVKPVISRGIKNALVPAMHYSKPSRQLKTNDRKLIEKAMSELIAFGKTAPPKARMVAMLEHFFQPSCVSEDGNTILHLMVFENNPRNGFLLLLIKWLLKYRQTNLINIPNRNGQTPLHLAVESHNIIVVEHLIYTQADVSIQDLHGNTAIHIAVIEKAPSIILKHLCMANNLLKFIDARNNEGFTALHLAVQSNNLPATKLLCWNKADVNSEVKKNGYTPLHIAVEEQNLDIVQFLLDTPTIETEKEDYAQCSALKLARVLDNGKNPESRRIYETIETSMKQAGTFEQVNIKEEVEDVSDEEMEDIKEEPTYVDEELQQKYANVKTFTESCLNEVCDILDKSGMWRSLADLLDYGHLLRSDLFNSSRSLLEFAMMKNEEILQIRNFLESLDELEAVQCIDKMARENCEN